MIVRTPLPSSRPRRQAPFHLRSPPRIGALPTGLSTLDVELLASTPSRVLEAAGNPRAQPAPGRRTEPSTIGGRAESTLWPVKGMSPITRGTARVVALSHNNGEKKKKKKKKRVEKGGKREITTRGGARGRRWRNLLNRPSGSALPECDAFRVSQAPVGSPFPLPPSVSTTYSATISTSTFEKASSGNRAPCRRGRSSWNAGRAVEEGEEGFGRSSTCSTSLALAWTSSALHRYSSARRWLMLPTTSAHLSAFGRLPERISR